MITDYGAFLRVTEDGHIWWLLKDAIRLGAGYLLVRDDHQTLATELRAPSNRALMNERTLIGAFGDTRLTIERPMTFERDGFRYVDAEGFLSWLLQYIAQTQAEITFPSELSKQLQIAIAKAAASRPPVNSQEFESLTLALENWFDRDLKDLPATLRQRVMQEFSPFPWDEMSVEQRHVYALRIDYQHDPATEQDRQYWWDFFEHLRKLEKELQRWQAVPTPTANDMLIQESRLRELQQEIDRMKLQQRQARGYYYPGRNNLDADRGAMPTAAYIAYPKAMKILSEKLKATPEELAAWIFLGPDLGGIVAYCNANELNPPPKFYFGNCLCEDYLSPLMACWFRQDDIDRFEPADHFITGAALIERWSKQPSLRPEAFIRAKIAESRLVGIHPIYGLTQGAFENDSNFPALTTGLFSMKEIKLIETEDDFTPALVPANSDVLHQLMDTETLVAPRYSPSNIRREARKLETQVMYKSWQKAYRDLFKKHKHKNMPDVWYSQQIEKMDIAEGRDAETIRKHMKD